MSMTPEAADREVLEASVRALTAQLDALVGACTGVDGSPCAPTRAELNKARAALPARMSNSFAAESARKAMACVS